jgi:hypothetical protein
MHSEFAACGFYTAFYVRLLRAASSCGYTASSFLVLMLQNLLRICSGHGSGRRKLSAGRWSAECVWVEAGVGVHVRRHATHDGQRTTGCPSTDLAPAISRAGQVTGARCSTSIMTSISGSSRSASERVPLARIHIPPGVDTGPHCQCVPLRPTLQHAWQLT